MNFNCQLSVAIMGVTIALVQPQAAVALSATEVGKMASDVTVLIEGNNSRGSGVIIRKEGDTYYVLTSKHVIAKEDKYTIVSPNGDRYPLDYKSINKLQPGLDLAILPFNSQKAYAVAKTGNSDTATAGTVVYVAGFSVPTAAVPNPIPRFIDGRITANSSKPLYDGYALVYSNNTLKGMSGGPVFNENGELVGIHGRAETTVDQNSRIVDTGYNLGIPINAFLTASSSTTAKVGANPPPSPSPTAPKADDFFIQAGDKSKKRDFQGAIASLNQAIQINPNYAEAYNERGFSRSQLKDYRAALPDFDRALFLNPNYAKAYINRGIARSQLGNYQGALADFDEAISLNRKDAKAYYHRGLVYSRQNNYQGAIGDFDQALSINPNHAQAYYHRGLARYNVKDYQGAIADLSQALTIEPNNAEVYLTRGLAREQLQDYQGALGDYDQFIRVAPKHAEAHMLRGNIRAKLGDSRGAMADLRQAATLAQQQGKKGLYEQAQNAIGRIKL